MANWIRSFSRLGANRIFSLSCLSTNKMRSLSAFSSAMQNVTTQKSLLDGSKNPKPKKRKSEWVTSYSKVTIEAMMKRLGVNLQKLAEGAIPVRDMLKEVNHEVGCMEEGALKALKAKVYSRIVEYIRIEGFPLEANPGFMEVNVNDLVLYILGPIILDFQNVTGREIQLRREMELIAPDSETGGYEEFVVVDTISTACQSFVFIIESKRTTLIHAISQCLLAMYDIYHTNAEGKIYGFVTMGEQWRMVSYDGEKFQMTDTFLVLFGAMRQQKGRWMEDFSVIVECILVALDSGGIVRKNGVV